MRSPSIVGLLLPLVFACRPTELEARPARSSQGTAAQERLDLPLAWPRLPLLPPGVRPKGWPAALAQWNTATSAYEEGDFEVAAERFLEVAATLKTKARESRPEVKVRATGRCLAYDNVGRALRAAGLTERARRTLTEAAKRDRACKNTIALRISRLEQAEPSKKPVRRAGP